MYHKGICKKQNALSLFNSLTTNMHITTPVILYSLNHMQDIKYSLSYFQLHEVKGSQGILLGVVPLGSLLDLSTEMFPSQSFQGRCVFASVGVWKGIARIGNLRQEISFVLIFFATFSCLQRRPFRSWSILWPTRMSLSETRRLRLF